ncbi:MAG: hypothetical protein J5965_14205 [Aeriscardovia sp.]|nr:hypothetical protein [Aeriscardovia sp.]
MNLKIFLCTILLSACVCNVAAQNSFKDRLYLTFNVTTGGPLNGNFKPNSFSIHTCGLQVGFRLKQHLAFFLTESAELSLTNIANTKNYNGTFSLGGGTSYNFPVNNYFSIEPALTCSSTIIKRQLNYLSPKLELRFCCHIPGASAIYLGFGLQYIHPYSKEIIPDLLTYFLTLGFKLF